MKITKFWAKDFRSLEDVTLDGLGDFNVFYGPNGSGKSNVLAGMRTLFELLSHLSRPTSSERILIGPEAAREGVAIQNGQSALAAGVLKPRDVRIGSRGRRIVLGARCEARARGGAVDTSLSVGHVIPGSITLELVADASVPTAPVLYLSLLEIDDHPIGVDRGLTNTDEFHQRLILLLRQRLPAAFGAVDAVRGTQLEVLQDAPAGQNPIRYHLAQGRLKNALFYAKNSSDAATRARMRTLRKFLEGPPLHRPELDTVLDPATKVLDLRESLGNGDVSLDVAGLGIAQMYAILAGVVLLGSSVISVEEPEAHLYAPSGGRNLAALLRRTVEEGIVSQLFIATHSNLFDLDPNGYWDVSQQNGSTVVERRSSYDIDRRHLYEPGPAKHALEQALRSSRAEDVVFRRPTGEAISAQEMLELLRNNSDDEAVMGFLANLHNAALRVMRIEARQGSAT